MVDNVALAMAISKPGERRLELRSSDRQDDEQTEPESTATSSRLLRSSLVAAGDTSTQDTNIGYTEYRQGLTIDTGSAEAFRVRRKIDCVIIPIFFISRSYSRMCMTSSRFAGSCFLQHTYSMLT
jgi:hypothetical protein